MRIERFTWRDRRDFKAIYICEHCSKAWEGQGYDDDYFHRKVIPNFECPECGKKAPDDYVPLATKYAAEEVI